jgi:hypothetical protein
MSDIIVPKATRQNIRFKFDKHISVPRDGSLEIDLEHRVVYVLDDVGSVLYMSRIAGEVTVRG